jgi:CRISPR-associated endonuclease Cas1
LNINIEQLKQNQKHFNEISEDQLNRNQILGYEGVCAQIYWQAVRQCLPKNIVCEKREKQEANDLFNVCLNYAYGIVKHKIHHSLLKASLSPLMGFLHQMNHDQNLIYDILEILRPIIDYKMILLLKSQDWGDEYLGDGEVVETSTKLILAPQHRKIIANEIILLFQQSINTYTLQNHHGTSTSTQMQLKDFIDTQCYNLAQMIINQETHTPTYFQI